MNIFKIPLMAMNCTKETLGFALSTSYFQEPQTFFEEETSLN